MSDDFREWYDFSAENAAKLQAILNDMIAKKTIKQNRLVQIAEWDQSSLSKWLSNLISLPVNRYFNIVKVGIEDGWLSDDSFLRRGLGHLLKIGEEIPTQINGRLSGYYKIYRFSFIERGAVLVGSLHVAPLTYRTLEIHRIQAGFRAEPEQASTSQDGWFRRTGVIVPRNRNACMMLSSKAESPSEVQSTFFEMHGESNAFMNGQFSDWHGTEFYTARIYAEKITSTGVPEHEICVRGLSEVPDKVQKYLTIGINHQDHIVTIA